MVLDCHQKGPALQFLRAGLGCAHCPAFLFCSKEWSPWAVVGPFPEEIFACPLGGAECHDSLWTAPGEGWASLYQAWPLAALVYECLAFSSGFVNQSVCCSWIIYKLGTFCLSDFKDHSGDQQPKVCRCCLYNILLAQLIRWCCFHIFATCSKFTFFLLKNNFYLHILLYFFWVFDFVGLISSW